MTAIFWFAAKVVESESTSIQIDSDAKSCVVNVVQRWTALISPHLLSNNFKCQKNIQEVCPLGGYSNWCYADVTLVQSYIESGSPSQSQGDIKVSVWKLVLGNLGLCCSTKYMVRAFVLGLAVTLICPFCKCKYQFCEVCNLVTFPYLGNLLTCPSRSI